MKEYMQSARELLAEKGIDPSRGLSAEEVEQSRKKYGENQFTREKPKTIFKRILEALCEPMLIILLVALAITVAVQIVRVCAGGEFDWIECVGIVVAVVLSVAISVVMEDRSARAFEALSKMSEDMLVKVVRDGETKMIPQKEVVVGDILCVETGAKLPADGRIIDSTQLMSDESALTGESMAVHKDADFICDAENTPVAERRNMLYSGCFITGGSGRAVVTGVGDNTEFGKIARELTNQDKSSTPLQEKLAKLGKLITTLGAIAAALIFVVQVIEICVMGFTGSDPALLFENMTGGQIFEQFSNAFIDSIVLIVAAVPEGLPTIVAVTLAIDIIKMSKQNALVKKLVACETVGCINVICSDKTGTLTENRMTVTDIQLGNTHLSPSELPKDSLMMRGFCVNSTADVHFSGNTPEFIGNPTECAMLVATHKSGVEYASIREAFKRIYRYPFSSETKNMTTVIDEDGSAVAYTKGSPEKILAMCDMPEEERRAAEEAIASYQAQAGRVIGFAHRRLEHKYDFDNERALVESHMTFDGFVVISDPLRADVFAAVERCRHAGIDIKMLTGDNIITAKAIATQLGILDEDHIVVEAKDLEDLSEEEFSEIVKKIRVIARSTPVIKMRVVKALKAQGNVVAVTGDGINDAPAIKNADVGVAMGITGTEVSKEASDIVLLDDSFSTIVKAVQWGRGIYENFQRFIQFQLTVNLSSVLIVFLCVVLNIGNPFTALQMLWINLIMDGPPAVTLGLEPMRDGLMDRKPTPRNSSIVSKDMLLRIVVNGLFMTLIVVLQTELNFLGIEQGHEQTAVFTLFVLFQLFNAFNARELGDTSIFRSFLKNHIMLGVFAGTFVLQIIITQFGGDVFDTNGLNIIDWLKVFAMALSIIVVSEVVKLIRRLVLSRGAKAAK
ncbi:MAG TPA: calcium-translocating P-type ATPase, PMCA-type [Candidatus Coproplasma excrementigallinarum]|uniref:P-type Ca(2+) transporter n=1 Tax=Candidatus Coproplasma excrementigallinarum TaxID=2840747 RepID=A0A9D1MKM9_9FIRM|nr:calcium-translocating P-type ATPase, PMCA-type [Candidatus Coproplasma excrementigallinarum]